MFAVLVGGNQPVPDNQTSEGREDFRAAGSTGFSQIRYTDRDNRLPTTVDWVRGTLDATDDQDSFTNNTGGTLYVDLFSSFNRSTTTGNFFLSVFSTTSATIPDGQDFLLTFTSDANQSFLLNRYNWATSTVGDTFFATSTSDRAQIDNKGEGLIPVVAGHSLVIYLQTDCKDPDVVPCPGATTTASAGVQGRNMIVDYFFRTFSTTTNSELKEN